MKIQSFTSVAGKSIYYCKTAGCAVLFPFLCMLVLLSFSLIGHSQDVNLAWATQVGEIGTTINGYAVPDAAGNVYTLGYFYGTIDADPGPGTYELTSSGSGDNFLYKLDAAGNFVWAKQWSTGGYTSQNSVAIDATGNVYITGYFSGTVDFDPGAGTYNLTAAGSTGMSDMFLCKLDAAGNFLWAKQSGGPSNDIGYAIGLDAAGNVYTTGIFRGTADFDPGPGTYNLTSAGIDDIFISKLDGAGNFVWAKSVGGPSGEQPGSIAVDAAGNVYIAGSFNDIVDLDPGPGTVTLTPIGSTDGFVIKLTPANTLPVTWIQVAARLNTNKQATITWKVQESNVQHYLLQKSTNGVTYNNIGTLESEGDGVHNYAFTESTALQGTGFYRILQVDIDGRCTYSPVVQLSFKATANRVSLYPNPAINYTTLRVTTDHTEKLQVCIIDNSGRKLQTTTRQAAAGTTLVPIPVQGLSHGTYFVSVMGTSVKAIIQLSIQ